MFEHDPLPDGIAPSVIDAINKRLPLFHERKVNYIQVDGLTRPAFLAAWARIYLQGHIRRALSLIEGGYGSYKNGEMLVASLCSRTLLEDAAVLYTFATKLTALIDSDVIDDIDDYIFSRSFSTKTGLKVETYGREVSATNVLTFIDKMVKRNAGYRAMYDDLSEVAHPNGVGIVFFYAQMDDASNATFHDGEHQSVATLGHFITSVFMLTCAEPDLRALEQRLDMLSNRTAGHYGLR